MSHRPCTLSEENEPVSTTISNLPKHERPRERLWARGVEALSERELLALVLRNGRQGESALDLAATLLASFGGVSGLAGAMPEEIASVSGIGQAKAAAVVAALRLGMLSNSEGVHPEVIRSAADVARIAQRHIGTARRERLIVLVCDGRNQVRHVVRVAEGAVDRSIFPVREILNAVLRHDGRAFAVAHNHPSGDPEPSLEDRTATAEILGGARTVGLRFLDHVVVAGGGWERVEATGRRRKRC